MYLQIFIKLPLNSNVEHATQLISCRLWVFLRGSNFMFLLKIKISQKKKYIPPGLQAGGWEKNNMTRRASGTKSKEIENSRDHRS